MKAKFVKIFLLSFFIFNVLPFTDSFSEESDKNDASYLEVPQAFYPQMMKQELSQDQKNALVFLTKFGDLVYSKKDVDAALSYVEQESFFTDNGVLTKDDVKKFINKVSSDLDGSWKIVRFSIFNADDYNISQDESFYNFIKKNNVVYVVNVTIGTVDEAPETLNYSGAVIFLSKTAGEFYVKGYSYKY